MRGYGQEEMSKGHPKQMEGHVGRSRKRAWAFEEKKRAQCNLFRFLWREATGLGHGAPPPPKSPKPGPPIDLLGWDTQGSP